MDVSGSVLKIRAWMFKHKFHFIKRNLSQKEVERERGSISEFRSKKEKDEERRAIGRRELVQIRSREMK